MRIKKKNTLGIARVFISQKKAMRKLQLSFKDFRRLCILKGVYPREPSHIKKANKGSTENAIFYHLKDINFLASEPLINKFREQRVFMRRVTSAKAKKEEEKAQSLLNNRPNFILDKLVRERYPTFSSALQDLDDALCLCFAFSALTKSKTAKYKVINECRRLTTEFMHYVIESRSLRKVFVSIKGIYYQAEIMGEKVTWVVGHERSVARANELDLSVMATFVDFYITMFSFVNFRLYKMLGLFYPPQLQKVDENDYFNDEEDSEKVYSLAVPINRVKKDEDDGDEDAVQIDSFEDGGDLSERIKRAEALKSLFSRFKFFCNREVPKEPLAFVARSCGGVVSWDGCPAAMFTEGSSLVTHQIVDRPIQQFSINRIYIQPQWVFDCFNARRLLPTAMYAPGVTLPPHLSPFIEENINNYIPPERIEQLKRSGHDVSIYLGEEKNKEDDKKKAAPLKQTKKKDVAEATNEVPRMHVKVGNVYRESHQKAINEEGHNRKLREMMIPKKHRRVYKKIKFGEKRRARELKKLQSKRAKLDGGDANSSS